MKKPGLDERLKSNQTLLMDGALGTELERRGYQTLLPLWSAMAAVDVPVLLHQIHADYLAAGAEIITANTFRTTAYTLQKTKQSHLAPSLTRLTIEIAREAIVQSGQSAWLAASIAPLEDCYRPDLVPPAAIIESAYTHQLDIIKTADTDLILAETMNNSSEAITLARLISETGIPFLMSFITDGHGHLLSGEPLGPVVETIVQYQPSALLINCRPVNDIDPGLRELIRHTGTPIGVYANGGGIPDDTRGWKIAEGSNQQYVTAVKRWVDLGASIIGGCCGTTPATIKFINQELRDAQNQ